MPDPVHTTWQLARAAARTLATSEALQAYASSELGAPLTVYLDGLPADRRGIRARLPYALVTAGTTSDPDGGPVAHAVRILLALDASALAPSAGAPEPDPDCPALLVVAGGEPVARLADLAVDALRAASLGSRIVSVERELDLVGAWPVRYADLTVNLEDLLAW